MTSAPARAGAGVQADPASRSVLERRRQRRRPEQRRRARRHRRTVVVGRTGLHEAPRVLPGHDHLRAQARPDDERHRARLRRHARQDQHLLGQLFRLPLRLQRRPLDQSPDRGLSRQGDVLVREPEGRRGALAAPHRLRADRQRVADLRGSHGRRQAGARVHHQGPLRLRRTRLVRPRRSRGGSRPSRPTTSTATSPMAWGSATSTATGAWICSRRTAGGSSRPHSPAIRSGGSTRSRWARAARRCTPTTSTATA